MTIPAIKAIKKAHPSAEIDLLCNSTVRAVFEGSRCLSRIIEFNQKGLSGILNIANMLKTHQYRYAFLLQNAFGSALSTFLAGIPKRIGYSRDCRGFLLTDAISYSKQDKQMHHIHYYLHMLKSYGIEADYTFPYIEVQPQEVQKAQTLLKDYPKPILVICPGASFGMAKRWLPEYFSKVADEFIQRYRGCVLIMGSPAETETARAIITSTKEQGAIFDLTGRLSLRKTIAVISQSDCVLSNDSGLMHVAYAVGKPLVAIFGSTSPELTGPQGRLSRVLRASVPCSPCFQRTCKGHHLKCMALVTPEMVLQAIEEILPTKKAVFFDRDGTLCKDAHYLNKWEDFELLPYIESLAELKNRGFKLIGVTNQSGIARGKVKEEFVQDVNSLFISKYCFEHFYYCPHHPSELCHCRKPLPAMLFEAQADFGINLKASFVVGDKDADMLLAKMVGAKAIFVLTGQQTYSEYADYTASDLKEVVEIILKADT